MVYALVRSGLVDSWILSNTIRYSQLSSNGVGWFWTVWNGPGWSYVLKAGIEAAQRILRIFVALHTFVAKCCLQEWRTFSADLLRLESRIRKLFSLFECIWWWWSVQVHCCTLSLCYLVTETGYRHSRKKVGSWDPGSKSSPNFS